MRVAALIAFALPVFVAAQLACDAQSTALCCFDSEDPTTDNFAQLSTLPDFQGAQLPVDSQGQIGLLCTTLDDSCTDTPMCCSDNSFNGVAAFGCAALAPPTTDSTDTTATADTSSSTTTSDTTDTSDSTSAAAPAVSSDTSDSTATTSS